MSQPNNPAVPPVVTTPAPVPVAAPAAAPVAAPAAVPVAAPAAVPPPVQQPVYAAPPAPPVYATPQAPPVYATPPPQQQVYAAPPPAEQPPQTSPPSPVAKEATSSEGAVSYWTPLEITRYVLYFFDLLWGVMMWSITADDVYVSEVTLGDIEISIPDMEGLDTRTLCLLDKVENRENINDFLEGKVFESGPCVAIIALGVIMFVVLLVIITLHSLKHLNRRALLPNFIEAILFAVMSLLWFILFIVALARTNGEIRELTRISAVIATGFLAGVSHAGSAVVAFAEHRHEQSA